MKSLRKLTLIDSQTFPYALQVENLHRTIQSLKNMSPFLKTLKWYMSNVLISNYIEEDFFKNLQSDLPWTEIDIHTLS